METDNTKHNDYHQIKCSERNIEFQRRVGEEKMGVVLSSTLLQ